MFFFFFFNQEQKLGFKRLTDADLGLGSSHQTHIGLMADVFTFLQDTDVVKSAMLIYGDYCDILDCSFDRIKSLDGTYRSAKIRTGADSNNSIVSKIREFAKQDPYAEWYLVWGGLDSEELVFWLLKKGSEDFKLASRFFPKPKHVYGPDDKGYAEVLNILTRKVNGVSINIQKELETASQIGDVKKKYKRTDVERANIQFKKIGTKGEELIALYLDKQKAARKIRSFIWENQSKESGLPYDFIINDGELYVDVKSTQYDFDQSIYFSDQEIEFASQNNEHYNVYRVYQLLEDKNAAMMKICNRCNPYLLNIDQSIKEFSGKIKEQEALLQTLKLGVLPTKCFTNILSPVKL